jgi:predicted TIM-barrel fold metal-dependent hydrolase
MSMSSNTYLPYKEVSRQPKQRLPKGSVDCHFHVFEDPAQYPYTANRSYTPTLAPWSAFAAMNDCIGADRAVLVHPSVYGHDHATFVDTLMAHPDRLRGVAVLPPGVSEQEIARLHAAGARGTRVNVLYAGGSQLSDAKDLVQRIKPFGWHLQFLADVSANPALPAQACEFGVPVVFDHFGHPGAQSPDDAGFKNLCAALKEGQIWVKISGAYRVVSADGQWRAIEPFVQALLHANPERLVWGTDWPHPAIGAPMPDDVDLAEMVLNWLPDEQLRQQVLVRNPEVLYGFAAWADPSPR